MQPQMLVPPSRDPEVAPKPDFKEPVHHTDPRAERDIGGWNMDPIMAAGLALGSLAPGLRKLVALQRARTLTRTLRSVRDMQAPSYLTPGS